jgi:hypothetical protein
MNELEAELQRFNQEFGFETELPKRLVAVDEKQRQARLKTKDPSVGPWMLKELLGAGHQPGERSTNPYLLGVVFEKLPKPLQQRWWRETDYGRAPRDVIAHLELVAAIADYVGSTTRKCAEMLKAQENPKVYSDKPDA